MPERGNLLEQMIPVARSGWRIVMSNWWQIFSITLAALLLGLFVASTSKPTYEAQTTLLIKTDKSQIVPIDQPSSGLRRREDALGYETEIQFLRSREIGLRVVRAMDLTTHPLFSSKTSNLLGGWSIFGSKSGAKPENDSDSALWANPAEEYALEKFLEGLVVDVARESRLLRISFRSEDPALAAQIANLTAQTYLRAELELRSASNSSATSELTEQLKKLNGRLRESEEKLTQFRQKNGLGSIDENSRRRALEQIDDLNKRIVTASAETAQARQRLAQNKGTKTSRSRAGYSDSQSEALADARASLDAARREFATVATQYGRAHPRFKVARSVMGAARAALNRQLRAEANIVESSFVQIKAAETALRDSLKEAQNRLRLIELKEADALALTQDVETSRRVYQTFLSRIKEIQASNEVQAPSASIIDVAVTPTDSSGPGKSFILALFGLAGLSLALLIAAVRHYLDDTIHDARQVGLKLGLDALASLPELPNKLRTERGKLMRSHGQLSYCASLRMVAATIEVDSIDKKVRSIAITSVKNGEDKETVITNLAVALSRWAEVLVIDADVENQVIAKMLTIKRERPGLMDVLAGRCKPAQAIHASNKASISVMTLGELTDDEVPTIKLKPFRKLVKKMEKRYDVVVINSSPLEADAAGLISSGACRDTLMVIRAGSTRIDSISNALQQLDRIGANMMGVILNGCKVTS